VQCYFYNTGTAFAWLYDTDKCLTKRRTFDEQVGGSAERAKLNNIQKRNKCEFNKNHQNNSVALNLGEKKADRMVKQKSLKNVCFLQSSRNNSTETALHRGNDSTSF
jgi:hypothetical protein